MNILGQIEIVVIFIAIFFARSMLAFAQYEIKSSKITTFVGQF